MGSRDDNLPVIDFSTFDLKPGTPEWESTRSLVSKAAEEYGCFQAVVRKFPDGLQPAINRSLGEVFELPLEAKRRNVSEKPFHGYFASSNVNPRFESLGVDHPETFSRIEKLTSTLWPEGNTNFRSKTLHSFCDEISKLDRLVRSMILESIGVDKYLEQHISSTYYTFRMMRYESPETIDRTIREKKVGLKAHVDQNTLTILHQNQVDGLDVQTRDGEWISVKFAPQCFLVLVGESFKVSSLNSQGL
ncbi:unnamed protein product [Linum tenue]|uniref:Uncharacterized protein n=1 Tax=Linum tenue TaxID=586396 RepID=A0AAV0I2V5_9ROSI|nr:unnamed protein product [Linum tenue]